MIYLYYIIFQLKNQNYFKGIFSFVAFFQKIYNALHNTSTVFTLNSLVFSTKWHNNPIDYFTYFM